MATPRCGELLDNGKPRPSAWVFFLCACKDWSAVEEKEKQTRAEALAVFKSSWYQLNNALIRAHIEGY